MTLYDDHMRKIYVPQIKKMSETIQAIEHGVLTPNKPIGDFYAELEDLKSKARLHPRRHIRIWLKRVQNTRTKECSTKKTIWAL